MSNKVASSSSNMTSDDDQDGALPKSRVAKGPAVEISGADLSIIKHACEGYPITSDQVKIVIPDGNVFKFRPPNMSELIIWIYMNFCDSDGGNIHKIIAHFSHQFGCVVRAWHPVKMLKGTTSLLSVHKNGTPLEKFIYGAVVRTGSTRVRIDKVIVPSVGDVIDDFISVSDGILAFGGFTTYLCEGYRADEVIYRAQKMLGITRNETSL